MNNLLRFINKPKVIMALATINKYYNTAFNEKSFFISQKDWSKGMEFEYSDNFFKDYLANTLMNLAKLLKSKDIEKACEFYNKLFKEYVNDSNLALCLFELLGITEYNYNENTGIYDFIFEGIRGEFKYNEKNNTIIYAFDDISVEYDKSNIEELAEMIAIIHVGLNDIGSYEN